MNVRCGRGERVHSVGRHTLNPHYVQTLCGYAGTSVSIFGYQPWIVETDEPVSCRKCLKASNQESGPKRDALE